MSGCRMCFSTLAAGTDCGVVGLDGADEVLKGWLGGLWFLMSFAALMGSRFSWYHPNSFSRLCCNQSYPYQNKFQ